MAAAKRFLDPVVARDVDGVDAVHRLRDRLWVTGLGRQLSPPTRRPGVEGGGFDEERSGRSRFSTQRRRQRAEALREVDVLGMEQREQLVDQRVVAELGFAQAQLGAHPFGPVPVVAVGEGIQHVGRGRDRRVHVDVEQRQQCLAEPCEVPLRDLRLVAVGVAATVIDRAEHGCRVERVHERAGPVVDRLAGDRRVVGVHDAVDEPDEHPASDQRCLGIDDALEERKVAILRIDDARVVTGDGVVGEALHERRVIARRRVLERADA